MLAVTLEEKTPKRRGRKSSGIDRKNYQFMLTPSSVRDLDVCKLSLQMTLGRQWSRTTVLEKCILAGGLKLAKDYYSREKIGQKKTIPNAGETRHGEAKEYVTVLLQPKIHARIKLAAARIGDSMSEVVECLIRSGALELINQKKG